MCLCVFVHVALCAYVSMYVRADFLDNLLCIVTGLYSQINLETLFTKRSTIAKQQCGFSVFRWVTI